MVNDTVAQLVNGLEGIAVVRLCVEAVLHIHLLKVAAAVRDLLRQVPASALNANVNILNCRTGIAAALSHLRGQIACVLSALIAQSTDSVVNATEVVVKGVVQRSEAVSEAIGLLIDLADKGLLINSGANIGLCSTRSAASVAIAATEAITAPAEQEEDDNPILLS